MRDGKHFWKINDNEYMKFNAIVGNPPYQENTTSKTDQGTPLYDLFYLLARSMKPNYISVIMLSRFFAGGMPQLQKLRDDIMNDKGVSKIVDFTNAKDCFPTIDIGGGVCYLLEERNRVGDCEFISIHNGSISKMIRSLNDFDKLVRYNEATTILQKIMKMNENSLSDICSSLMPYGLSTNYRGSSKRTSDEDLTLISSAGLSYIKPSVIKSGRETVNKYKVLVSKTSAEHAGEPDKKGQYRVLTASTQVIGPKVVCTHSYFIIGSYDDIAEANNLLSYLKTNLVRFLMLMSLTGIGVSKLVFTYVPIQDFTSKSDIDWSKSIEDIDCQLYAKYGLNEEETAFIEKMIKPM
jgi:site-specific DNA-methyltransferase (adenine-specific)